MPTLFPPLETEGTGDSVLSDEVRANFEAIQSIVRAQSRLKKENVISVFELSEHAHGHKRSMGEGGCPGEDDVAFACKPDIQDLESRKRALAVTTAVALQNEISRLTNGIAELETLLLQQGNVDPSEIEFPILPTIIAEEDTIDHQDKKRESNKVDDSETTQEDVDLLDREKK